MNHGRKTIPRIKNDLKFATDVLKLTSGTTIAQILAIAVAPILTRIYNPEAFGISTLFISTANIFIVIACLRYEFAIMLPENNKESANILSISIIITALITSLCIIIIPFEGDTLLSMSRQVTLSGYLWMMPVYISASGIVAALSYWSLRGMFFDRISIVRISSSVIIISTQLIAGFSGHANGGNLILANMFGVLASAMLLSAQVWRSDCNLLKGSINWHAMKIQLLRYRKFPMFDTWSALLTTISWQLPVLILSIFFSSAVLGYYAICMMVLQVPMSFIGGSVAQVFFQRAAMAKSEGILGSLVEDIVLRLETIVLLPAIMLAFVGKDAFIFVFGEHWAEAGVYSQILSVWVFFFFITSPISSLFSIFEKQDTSLILNAVAVPVKAAVLIESGFLGNARVAIMLFSLVDIVFYITALYLLTDMAGVQIYKLLRRLIKNTTYCIPIVCLLIPIKLVFNSNLFIVIALCIAIAIVYYSIFLYKLDIIKLENIQSKILNRIR